MESESENVRIRLIIVSARARGSALNVKVLLGLRSGSHYVGSVFLIVFKILCLKMHGMLEMCL